MVYSTARSAWGEILVRGAEYVRRIEERTGDHFTTRERLRAALDDPDGHLVAEALSQCSMDHRSARRICDVDSGGLLRRETEQRLEAIAEALPAFFSARSTPLTFGRYFGWPRRYVIANICSDSCFWKSSVESPN